MRQERITPSLVISLIALIVALGGVSYAAIEIPNNSVGTKQLKRNAVSTAKLKANSVNSSRVRDRTLLRSDFRRGQIPGATFYSDRGAAGLLPVPGDFIPVVETAVLPAGPYILQARANIIGGGGGVSQLTCSMVTDAAQNFTLGSADVFPLSMAAVATLSGPSRLALQCRSVAGAPQIAQAAVIATRVASLTGSLP